MVDRSLRSVEVRGRKLKKDFPSLWRCRLHMAGEKVRKLEIFLQHSTHGDSPRIKRRCVLPHRQFANWTRNPVWPPTTVQRRVCHSIMHLSCRRYSSWNCDRSLACDGWRGSGSRTSDLLVNAVARERNHGQREECSLFIILQYQRRRLVWIRDARQ